MSDFWFFISHAGRDVDEYMKRFWTDLAVEVGDKAGLVSAPEGQSHEFKPEEFSFLDRTGLLTGAHWPPGIVAALQASRTLVCLYSAGFFNAEYCGKEVSFFLDRIGQSEAASQPLIFPVLWEHPGTLPAKLPSAVAEIQYVDDELGRNYRKYGLRYLMKLQQYGDDYTQFVERFALRLVRAARPDSLSPLPNPPSLADCKNAFKANPSIGNDESQSEEDVENVGPNTAKFLFVAGKETDFQNSEAEVRRYGRTAGREWKPYFPESDTVGLIAQKAAVLENLFYENPAVGGSLIADLKQAEKNNTIVIIVVDPWTIMGGPFKNWMLEFDEQNFINCALLVPWNSNDGDPSQPRNQLQKNVRQTLSRNFVLNSPFIRESILSSDDLQRRLVSTIHEVRKRIVQRAEVFRRIESEQGRALPTVSGAEGGTTQT